MVNRLRGQRGVTLVELMVVVAIIAIIAAIAITLYQDVQKKAKLAADQGVAAAVRSAVAIYYGRHNGNFPDLGLVTPLVSPVLAASSFQCSGGTVAVDAATGTVAYTPNLISAC